MKRQSILLLAIGAVVAVAIAYFVSDQEANRYSTGEGELLFPNLEAELDNVTRIELKTANSSITLTSTDQGWGVAERGGYRANTPSIRQLMLRLTQTRLLEPKTTDPAKYPRLGVGAVDSDDSAQWVRLLKADDTVVADVILGNAAKAGGVYLRKPDDAQSWRGSEKFGFGVDHTTWLDRHLLDINQGEVVTVAMQPTTGNAYVIQQDDNNQLSTEPGVPSGKRHKPGMLNRMISVMQTLKALDVVTDLETLPQDDWTTATYTLKNGVAITLTTHKALPDSGSNNSLLKVSAAVSAPAADQDAASQQAKDINDRLAGHVYQIPEHQGLMMSQPHARLFEDLAE